MLLDSALGWLTQHYIATDETRQIAVLGPKGCLFPVCRASSLHSAAFLSFLSYATCTTHHSSALLCTPNYAPFQSLFCITRPLPQLLGWPFPPSQSPLIVYIYTRIPIHPSIHVNQSINQASKPPTHPPTHLPTYLPGFGHLWTS